jgi:hypothetical protein
VGVVPLRYVRGTRLRGEAQCLDQRLVVELAFIGQEILPQLTARQ